MQIYKSQSFLIEKLWDMSGDTGNLVGTNNLLLVQVIDSYTLPPHPLGLVVQLHGS